VQQCLTHCLRPGGDTNNNNNNNNNNKKENNVTCATHPPGTLELAITKSSVLSCLPSQSLNHSSIDLYGVNAELPSISMTQAHKH